MKPAILVALVLAIVNIVPGIIFVLLRNPLGNLSKKIYSKLPIHPPGSKWLHEGERIYKFFLILGLWLILWGALISTLFYYIIDKNEKGKNNNQAVELTEKSLRDFQ